MIRITFIGAGHRSPTKEYETDDTQEALSEEVAKWYRDSGKEHPETTAFFAVLIERDDSRMEPAEVVEKLEEIAGIERWRATRDG